MVVIKLVVKDPSEKRKRRQLLPTPAKANWANRTKSQQPIFVVIMTTILSF